MGIVPEFMITGIAAGVLVITGIAMVNRLFQLGTMSQNGTRIMFHHGTVEL